MNGTQGNLWKNANITLPVYKDLSLMFEAIVGADYKGDIALDDVTVSVGPCFGSSSELSSLSYLFKRMSVHHIAVKVNYLNYVLFCI